MMDFESMERRFHRAHRVLEKVSISGRPINDCDIQVGPTRRLDLCPGIQIDSFGALLVKTNGETKRVPGSIVDKMTDQELARVLAQISFQSVLATITFEGANIADRPECRINPSDDREKSWHRYAKDLQLEKRTNGE